MPIQYAGHHRGAPRGPVGRRAVRPVAHGRARRRGPRGRRGPRRRARHGPAGARRRPGALLDDLRPGRRDPRRPDRLPPGRGPVHGRRQRARTRGSCRTRSRSGSPGSGAVLDDRCLATGLVAVQGPRSLDILQPLTDARPRARSATTGSPRASVAGIPAQVARTGYTGEDGFELFVDVDRAGEPWDALLEAGRAARPGAGRPRRPRHAAARGRHAALRQRARPHDQPVRGGPRPRRQARQARRLRRPRGAREGRRDGVRRQLVGLVVRGRGIARHGYPVPSTPTGADRASVDLGHDVADAGRRRSRWPTSPPADAGPGTMLAVEIRGTPRRRPRSSRSRSTRGPPEAAPARRQPPRPRRPRRHDGGAARWSPATCATPRITSGSASRATRPSSGSPQYAADQLGDIVFVELPDVGQRARAARDVRRRRVGQGGERPVRAGRGRGRRRSTRRSPASPSSSTTTRTATAGCSGCGSPTRPRSTACSTPRPTSS